MDTPVCLRLAGWRGRVFPNARAVRIDPFRGTIERGRQSLNLDGLRVLEVQQGFLTLAAGAEWMTIDLERHADGDGALLRNGVFSPGGLRILDFLRSRLQRARDADRDAGEATTASNAPSISLRYRLRVDGRAIVLTVVSLALLLVDLHHTMGRWMVSPRGLELFSIGLAVWLSAWGLRRWRTRLEFDRQGFHRRGLLGSRTLPWEKISEFRVQQAEIELLGEGIRAPLSLDLMCAGSAPMVLRRRGLGFFSAPARTLLHLLSTRAREGTEKPLGIDPAQRRKARAWIGTLIAVHAAIYFASVVGGEERFSRIRNAFARQGNWTDEPWRLLTSLFLHGSLLHIVFNMLMAAALAVWVGRVFGWVRMIALYFASGVLGNLISESMRGSTNIPALGSSTAIMGLVGVLLHATVRWPDRLPLAARSRFRWALPFLLLFLLGVGQIVEVLDDAAHIGGAVSGFLVAYLLRPPKEKEDKTGAESRTGP